MFVPEIITGLRSFFYPNCTHILTNRAINSGPVFVHTLLRTLQLINSADNNLGPVILYGIWIFHGIQNSKIRLLNDSILGPVLPRILVIILKHE